jgi:hypothetical protein
MVGPITSSAFPDIGGGFAGAAKYKVRLSNLPNLVMLQCAWIVSPARRPISRKEAKLWQSRRREGKLPA